MIVVLEPSLYLADNTNSTIRQIELATGKVTTIAGTAGQTGSTDANGTMARFFLPLGVVLDGAGDLYIADSFNDTFRKMVLSTGQVTTIAGTPRTAGMADGTGAVARFNVPYGVVLDGGNLYTIDTNNNTIRKIVPGAGAGMGVVTTLFGSAGVTGSMDGMGTAARFNTPEGLAGDGAGTLYVSDSFNHTIRQVVLATSKVTTIAGAAGVSGSADGNGTAARFNIPVGLALDGTGNLYICDSANSTLRKMDLASGKVTTVVGVAGQKGVQLGALPGGLSQPGYVTVGPTGELVIVDRAANVVLAVR